MASVGATHHQLRGIEYKITKLNKKREGITAEIVNGEKETSPGVKALLAKLKEVVVKTEYGTNNMDQGRSVLGLAGTTAYSINDFYLKLRDLKLASEDPSLNIDEIEALSQGFNQHYNTSGPALIEQAQFNNRSFFDGTFNNNGGMNDDKSNVITPGVSTLAYPVGNDSFSLNGIEFKVGATLAGNAKFANGVDSTTYTYSDTVIKFKAASNLTPNAEFSVATFEAFNTNTQTFGTAETIKVKAIDADMSGEGIARAIMTQLNSNTYASSITHPIFGTIEQSSDTITIKNILNNLPPKIKINASTTYIDGIQYGGNTQALNRAVEITAATTTSSSASSSIQIADTGSTAAANIAEFFKTGLQNAPDAIKAALSSFEVTQNGSTLTIKSTQDTAGGIPVIRDAAGISIGSSSSKVGSLGVANIAVSGLLMGKNANWIVNDATKGKAATASVPLNGHGNIGDNWQFKISGEIGELVYTFKDTPTSTNPLEVQVIPGDPKQSFVNLVKQLRQSNNPLLRSLDYQVANVGGATNIVITSKTHDDTFNGIEFSIIDATRTQVGSAVALAGGVADDLNFSKAIANEGLIGEAKNFSVKAKYKAKDQIDLSFTAGDTTYTATNVNTLPKSDTVVRFVADGIKGYFDVKFAKDKGMSVNDIATADEYATEIKNLFSGVKLYQTRNITNFDNITGQLANMKVELTSSKFDKDLYVRNFDISENWFGKNKLSIALSDGRNFVTQLNKPLLSAGSIIEITNAADENEKIRIHLAKDINLSDESERRTLSTVFSENLRNPGGMELSLSPKTSGKKLNVTMKDLRPQSMFGGQESFDLAKPEDRKKIDVGLKKAFEIMAEATISIYSNLEVLTSIVDAGKKNILDQNKIIETYNKLDELRSFADYQQTDTNIKTLLQYYKFTMETVQEILRVIQG